MNLHVKILTLLMFFWCVQCIGQTKRALVIGIGEQQDKAWNKINGDKDIAYVVEYLRNGGFNSIKTLVNKQATKASIVAAFKRLTAKCVAGDIIYIHFSGHGQQVTDVNGDEKDGWDEAWIPYDAYLCYNEKKDKGEKHLIDDELNTMLTAIRKRIGSEGKMLVVVDACHSGDSSRGQDDEIVRGVKEEFVIPIGKKKAAEKLPEQWITLSACKDYQLNQEMKNPQVGKLTYTLYTISKNGNMTMEQIQTHMQKHRGRYVQTPVLTGETSVYNLSDFF